VCVVDQNDNIENEKTTFAADAANDISVVKTQHLSYGITWTVPLFYYGSFFDGKCHHFTFVYIFNVRLCSNWP